MRSTFAGLNTMVSGLNAHRLALETTGHNVSNAATDGYTRQRANIVSNTPDQYYSGTNGGPLQLGSGASVEAVKRLRDMLTDKQYWKENSTLGRADMLQEGMKQIEFIFQEPSDTGIQNAMNNFWNAWQTLATGAQEEGARAVVRQRGQELIDTLGLARDQLKAMAGDIGYNLQMKAVDANQYIKEIYDLNKAVSYAEFSGGSDANDLRDRRDLLVDKLSKIVDVRVSEDSQGRYRLVTGNETLVGENSYQALKVEVDQSSDLTSQYGVDGYRVMVNEVRPCSCTSNGGPDRMLPCQSGEIKGLMQSQEGVIKYMDKLAQVGQFLMSDFNAGHRTGFGKDDSTNLNFFSTNVDAVSFNDGTLYQESSVNIAATYVTPANGDTITLSDGVKSTTVTFVVPPVAPVTNDPAGLAAQINAKALADGVSVSAKYDAGTGKFSLFGNAMNANLSYSSNNNTFLSSLKLQGAGVSIDGTIMQKSKIDVSALAIPTTGTITLTDDKGQSLTLDFAAPPPGYPVAPAVATMSDVANAINYLAIGGKVGIRAQYTAPPLGTGTFSLHNVSGAKSVTMTSTGTASTFQQNLQMVNPQKKLWVDELQVNPKLFDPTKGLDRIAAKTAAGQVTDTSKNIKIWKGNTNGGDITAQVGGSYTFNPESMPIRVRIKSLQAVVPATVPPTYTGAVTGAEYSIDGGVNWKNATQDSGNSNKFLLVEQGATVSFNIATNINNKVTDVYTLTLPAGNQGNAAGGNAVNMANFLKLTSSAKLGNTSLEGFYSALIGEVGVDRQSAMRLQDNEQALIKQIQTWRESVSGVNLDEELADMIRFQKGYSSSARVMTTLDEMLDKLINGTGMVGR